jgi:hypothetical protein
MDERAGMDHQFDNLALFNHLIYLDREKYQDEDSLRVITDIRKRLELCGHRLGFLVDLFGESKESADIFVGMIPGIISKLKLYGLAICLRNLRGIGNAIFEMHTLNRLTLMSCCLVSLPVEIFKMKNLEYLDVRDNQLTYVPKDIEKLIKLKELYLRNNPIRWLPDGMEESPYYPGFVSRLNLPYCEILY